MRPRKILHQFTAKDGRKVILGIPEWEDVDDLAELNDSIVDEGVDIATRKITGEVYADQFKRRLALMEKGEVLGLVAEVEGKAIAGSIDQARWNAQENSRLSEEIDRYEDGGFKMDWLLSASFWPRSIRLSSFC